ncbi:hypothetical protein BDV29DRAFT_166921 [Aspergillus leporis]|uniref:F-box domain-containing protein n=1 Tax=Aspergillus leporis TaxID=41062 RepID=A0A5N5XD89_9EURO|nr:hypothetical protein BDV29DRAFT_166921 [Aspergillus leporis]
MAQRLPWEILFLVFENLAANLLEQDHIKDLRNLLFVSKIVQKRVEPFLYEEFHLEGDYDGPPGSEPRKAMDSTSPLLCRTILTRPELGGYVKKISMEQSQVTPLDLQCWDYGYDSSEEEPEPPFRPAELDAARAFMEGKFRPDKAKDHWLQTIKDPNEVGQAAMQGLLLCHLPNLASLTLTLHSGMFGHIGTFLQLPYLEELSLTIDMGDENDWSKDSLEEPEDILESILSGTQKIKKLVFDHYRNVCAPIIFDGANLKRILDHHVAETVEELSITLSLSDRKDWRMPQEYARHTGVFGSMTHFTKLQTLSIQLELLLGEPWANPHHLKDVLPNQLQSLTCFSLHSYSRHDDDGRIWDWESCFPEFQFLANAAQDGLAFPSLDQVDLVAYRNDDFNKYSGYHDSSGTFKEEGLADSRIAFSWY